MNKCSRRRLLVAVGLLAVGAVVLHRWPWRRAEQPDAVDLSALRQDVEALELDADQASAAPDPVAGYVPKVSGLITDLSAPAAEILKQLPGVVSVEVLVPC